MLDIEKNSIQSFLRTDKLWSLAVMLNLCSGFIQQQLSTTHSFAYSLPSGIREELQKNPTELMG